MGGNHRQGFGDGGYKRKGILCCVFFLFSFFFFVCVCERENAINRCRVLS